MEERIKARIAELRAAREAYRIEAEKQLLGFDATIGELEALLTPLAPAPETNSTTT